jgi:hypothetical protein
MQKSLLRIHINYVAKQSITIHKACNNTYTVRVIVVSPRMGTENSIYKPLTLAQFLGWIVEIRPELIRV